MFETLLSQGGAPLVRRRIAPNPSPMTERGTNSYVLGAAETAVIDPGPPETTHLSALASVRPTLQLITHTHLDHSAASPRIEAPSAGFGPHGAGQSPLMAELALRTPLSGGEGADRAFAPDRRLADGARIEAANGEWALTALHTPGHLGNHLCFALEDAAGAPRALFSGDLVMGWATSLVSPPDGDMAAFMASLARLSERADPVYLPGHGAAISNPAERLAELIAHRRGREAQILEALAEGAQNADALVAALYRDLDRSLHAMARRNVLAHLIDLWARGRIAATPTTEAADFDPGALFALTGPAPATSDERR